MLYSKTSMKLLYFLLALTLHTHTVSAQVKATLVDQLVVDSNSDNQLGAGEVIEYTVKITNNGDTPLSNITYEDTLDDNVTLISGENAAEDDRYLLTGSGIITVDKEHGVIHNNDTGTELTVSLSDTTTEKGRTVTVNSDGSFTYDKGTFNGKDSFNYTVMDPLGNRYSALVTLFTANTVHYVDNTKDGNGTFSSPYGELFEADQNSNEGDAIFVFSGDKKSTGQSLGIFIQNNQTLIGQSSPLHLITAESGFLRTLPGAATPADRPLIIKTRQDSRNGTAVVAGDNTTIIGFRIGDSSAEKNFINALFARDFSSIYIREISIANSNSYLIDLRRGKVDAIVDSLTNLSPAIRNANLVNLDTCSGTFEVTGESRGLGQGISISGSVNAKFNYVNITETDRRAISYVNATGSLVIDSPGGQILFDDSNDYDAISIADASNFLLKGTKEAPFIISGSGFGQGAAGSGNFGISITDSSNIEFSDLNLNTGSGSSDTGIAINGSDNITLKDSIVTVNGGARGIQIGRQDSEVDSKIDLIGNTINGGNNVLSDNLLRGISAVFGSNSGKALELNINDNKILSIKENAIEIALLSKSGTGGKRNLITLTKNSIFDPGKIGTTLQASGESISRFIVDDNEIDGEKNIPYSARDSNSKPRTGATLVANESSVSDLTLTNNSLFDIERDHVEIRSFNGATIRTEISGNQMIALDELDIDSTTAVTVLSQSTSDRIHATIRDNIFSLPDSFLSLEGYSTGTGSLTCLDISNNSGLTAGSSPVGRFRFPQQTGTLQIIDKDNLSSRNNGVTVSIGNNVISSGMCEEAR